MKRSILVVSIEIPVIEDLNGSYNTHYTLS
ncbi:hypothetical protein TPER_HE00458 [Candidatus Hoaglandella endobia]|uniref:Uncharacterized protein n=1 Tax=Candidatus Hoaglandella endobia TaxID=1778263 RepID=A0A143WUI4_9ENTR|nr:hypothetical protein TPER_HE00458 [Candidatus Hoaglandella endobia]